MANETNFDKMEHGDSGAVATTELDRVFDLQRAAYDRNRMPPAEERIGHLKKLERADRKSVV